MWMKPINSWIKLKYVLYNPITDPGLTSAPVGDGSFGGERAEHAVLDREVVTGKREGLRLAPVHVATCYGLIRCLVANKSRTSRDYVANISRSSRDRVANRSRSGNIDESTCRVLLLFWRWPSGCYSFSFFSFFFIHCLAGRSRTSRDQVANKSRTSRDQVANRSRSSRDYLQIIVLLLLSA